VLRKVGDLARRAARVIAREPPALGPLRGEVLFLVVAVVIQWLALGALAAAATHNAWFYYQGGDETFFYTTAWIISQGHLPLTGIGYAWSLVEAPIAAVAGPSVITALPGIIAVQVVLLLPLGLVAFYGLTKRLLGAFVARVGVVAWIAAPYAVIPLFVERYHERWVDLTLPQLLGLTGMGDFASMVLLVSSAYLVFRYLDEGGWEMAALAGLVAGFALGLKPSTALFLAGPAAGIALARRWRGAVSFGVALLPALIALVIWKQRGLGHQPIFSTYGTTELAVGVHTSLDQVVATSAFKRYLGLDWDHLSLNLDLIREYFWSNRLVEWLPLAGALGALRRSAPKALVLIGWLAAYVATKGSSDVSSVDTASFWRLLSPAWPAYLLLAVSIVALVPRAFARAGSVGVSVRSGGSHRRTLAVAALLLGLIPVIVVSALPRDRVVRSIRDNARNLLVPIDSEFRPTATASGDAVTLRWKGPNSGSVEPTYFVIRASSTGSAATDGLYCDPAPIPVPNCEVSTTVTELGYRTSPFVDKPGRGSWVYRIAQAASHTGDPDVGDPLVYSEPALVTVS
jgi:hypothetical protein